MFINRIAIPKTILVNKEEFLDLAQKVLLMY